jgi:murein DD-endopeptidase MepM/ murein hydrolase activator NlpD
MLLLLSGCTASSTSTSSEVAPLSETPARRDQPTPAQVSEPTAVFITPTTTRRAQLTATSTERPTEASTPMLSPTMALTAATPLFSYPIGVPGKPLGDGFFIRDGAQVENTWYNPGYWHTGEDWYTQDGDTAGARVYAVADGETMYAGANYPGRVVIVRHTDALYSMYGHLDPKLLVRVGQRVKRGDLIGTVLRRGDQTPNHLHFEMRTFLTTPEVNGSAPRYAFRCGVNCPPGPGYWPIKAPDLPSDLGWRNPTHVIAHRMLLSSARSAVVVATRPVSQSVTLWSAPPGDTAGTALGELELKPGEQFSLLEIYAGPEDTRQTSALAYQLWYNIKLPDGRTGWVQAAVSSTFETGSDGRPSSVYFNFLPVIAATA